MMKNFVLVIKKLRNNSTALYFLGRMFGCFVSSGKLALLCRPFALRAQLESMNGDRETISLFEETVFLDFKSAISLTYVSC